MVEEKRLSTTAMAKQVNLSTKELFALLAGYDWIEKTEDGWSLTALGKEVGGEYVTHPKYGKYITWPGSIVAQIGFEEEAEEAGPERTLSATAVGKRIGVSAQRVNSVFSEIGWIEKGLKGWKLTEQGHQAGGLQKEHPKSGVPYVCWQENALENTNFRTVIRELEEGSTSEEESETEKKEAESPTGFREKFAAKLRATDGHYVRSKAEMIIDNWLYMAEIVHAYERKLPVEEALYCDFYIPSGKVYIEYWGYENDPKYLVRKEKKLAIYAKYQFKLIELNDKDIENLDDVLPRLLLKHGVESF